MVDVTPTSAPAPVPPPAGGGAPPPAPAPAPAPETILNAPAPAAGDAPPVPVAGEWPEDWRERLAGEDKAYLKTLARLASPLELAKKARSLEQKLSSGDYLKPFPAEGTDEDKATWRKEQGIPDKPEGYVESIKLSGGLVLGEADKPVVTELAKSALAANIKPEQFNALTDAYYQIQEQQKIAQVEADGVFHTESLATLGAEFGAGLKRELGVVNSFLSSHFPKEVADSLLAARGPDGRMLGDNPAIIKSFIAAAREVNPLGSLLPAGVSDPAKSAVDRLAELRGMMKDSAVWTYGPKSAELQAQYLALVEGQEKMQARSVT